MSGPPKGRTVKALREAVDRLAAKPASRDDANRLRNYLESVKLAQELRAERVCSLPSGELTAIIKAMLHESVRFSLQVKQGLLDHKVAELVQRLDMPELLTTLMPWSTAESPEFDPLVPTLSSLVDISLPARIAQFKQSFWSRAMTPLLMNYDGKNTVRIAAACDSIIKTFSEQDVVELDATAASLTMECLTCARGLKVLTERSVDGAFDEELDQLRSRRGKTDRSVLTATANNIFNNKILAETMTLFTQGRSMILEYGGKILQHMQTMKKLQPTPDGFVALSGMLADLGRVRSCAAACLFDDFADALLRCVLSTWSHAESNLSLRGGDVEVNAGNLKILEKFASDAAIVFSLEEGVTNMQYDIAALLARQSGTSKLHTLRACLEKDMPAQDDTTAAEGIFVELLKALEDASGMTIDDDMSTTICEKMQAVALWLGNGLRDMHMDNFFETGLDVWSKLAAAAKVGVEDMQLLRFAKSMMLLTRHITRWSRAPDAESKRAAVQDMSVKVAQSAEAAKIVKARAQLSAECSAWCEASDQYIERGEGVVGEWLKLRFENDIASLQTAVAEGETLANNLHLGDPWHATSEGTTPEAWTKLQELADESIRHVDSRKLEACLRRAEVELKNAEESGAVVVQLGKGDPVEDTLREPRDKYKKLFILLKQILLMWHLSNETDKDVVRKRVQEQVKGLRALSVREKDVLPAVLYHKSFLALQCQL